MPTPEEIKHFIKIYQRKQTLKKIAQEDAERQKRDDYYGTIRREIKDTYLRKR